MLKMLEKRHCLHSAFCILHYRLAVSATCGRWDMTRTAVALVALGFVAGLGAIAHAQGIVMQRNLSLAMAKTIAEATLAECQAKGFHTSAAVVDRAGQPLVLFPR